MSYNKTKKISSSNSKKSINFFEKYDDHVYSNILSYLNTNSLGNLSNINKRLNSLTRKKLTSNKLSLLNKYKKKIVKIIDLDSVEFLTFNVINLNKKDKDEFFKLAKQRKRYNSLENNKKINIFIVKKLLEPGYLKLRFNRVKFKSKKIIYIFKFLYLNKIEILLFELDKNNELQLIENNLIIDYFKNKYFNK